MYCTILYYTILYYNVLHYTILYYAMLCYTILCVARGPAPALPLLGLRGALHSAKGGAVETGCSGLHYSIGRLIL